MTEKEIAEIRRRFRSDKSNISKVRGCYVNEQKQIVSEFSQSLGLMTEDETDAVLSIVKKTLSGTLGKNLLDIAFTPNQVTSGAEHKTLMAIKNSSLDDDDAVQDLYARIIPTLSFESSYLIILSCDKYDVPSYSKNDEENVESTEMFSYILCTVCPVKVTKTALSYNTAEKNFRNVGADWVLCAPELGFMFPAFDERATNLYNALFYSRNIADSHEEFVDAVFKSPAPMPAAEQKDTFNAILETAMSEECSYDVVRSVHEQFSGLIEEHKASKESEPLLITKRTIKRILETGGVSEPHIAAAEQKYDSEFGSHAELSPKNLVDPKQFELHTPDITIKVNPERKDLVKTQVIDGTKYILIRADDTVEVNGVNINIS